MTRRAALFLGAALLAAAAHARACGYCVEDKIAAVYDHASVLRAAQQRHSLVYFAIVGDLRANEATRREIAAAAAALKGVDADSVRVSLPAASLALAFDAQAVSLATLESTLSRRLSTQRLALGVLRVVAPPRSLVGAR